MRGLWLPFVLLAGCGDDLPEDGEGVRSGSRLRITWFDFDGTRQWQPEEGFRFVDRRFVDGEVYFDRQRDEPCSPQPWLDGITRCTPEVEVVDRKYFTDDLCTMRVTENPQIYKYVADYDPKCNVQRRWHVYPIVAVIPRPQLFYLTTRGDCLPSPSSALEVGVLGAEVGPERFATVTMTANSDDRIAIRSRESDDGMRLPLGLRDKYLGDSKLAGEVVLPLAPQITTASSLFYADAACTRAYLRVDAGCAAPQNALVDGEYTAIGERATAIPAYSLATGSCAPLVNPTDGDYFEVKIANPIELVTLAVSVDEYPVARIRLQHAVGEGVRARVRALHDTQFATDCVPRKFPDDVYRCMPDPQHHELFPAFIDATCETTIDVARAVPPHPRPRLAVVDNTLLGGGLRLFEVGDAVTEPLYIRSGFNGTMCVPAGLTDEVYRVGRQVEWSELATATLATD
ncbi:MAG TPA: hypothetical protein VIV11_10495 [Kofleriaceae bacterium]